MSFYYQDDHITLHHGDCIETMRTMPDDSIDSIVTDPPYNLSSGKKRDLKCIRQAVAEILLPNDDNGNAQRVESGDLPIPSLLGPLLSGEGGATGIDTRIGMPEGSVDLQGATVSKHEVNAGNEPSTLASDEMLPSEGDAKAGQLVGNFILQLADGIDAPFCDGTCSCFTEPSAGVIAVAVVAPRLASCDGSSVRLVVEGNRVVRASDDAGRDPKGASGVHAGGRAVDRFMLRLDLRGGTGELVPAGGALDGLPLFELVSAESVGAGSGASRLSPMAKPYRVGLVDGSAGGAFTIYHVAHIKHSTTGGFMGKEWDGWDNPASFQRWATAWARECLRVLKPGGHILAFGGTRTWHRLAVAIEDAGLEMRDSLAWLYGSGFPKSHDISKAIDKMAGAERDVLSEKPASYAGMMKRDFQSGQGKRPDGDPWGNEGKPIQITAPATSEAQQWEGWGTALKPAFEPIVMARKPLAEKTVARNVLAHGTGAINVDACRIGLKDDETAEALQARSGGVRGFADQYVGGKSRGAPPTDMSRGRWPANVLLDQHAAAWVDEQSGVSVSTKRLGRYSPTTPTENGVTHGKMNGIQTDRGVEDSGGASRFFYSAKAPKSERPLVDGVAHATVKPLKLMRYLVRMVTPPGGTILEPFAGSGTTIEAAMLEGFNVIGIERETEYLPLIEARIARAKSLSQEVFDFGGIA